MPSPTARQRRIKRKGCKSLAEGHIHCTRRLCCLSTCLHVLRMDGRSGLPLIVPPNPGLLLRQTKLPGQEEKADDKKASWVRAGYEKRGTVKEKDDSWHSCIGCGEARSTKNVTRLKEHLLVCLPYLLSATAEAVRDTQLQERIARAKAAPPTGMSQSTLTVGGGPARRGGSCAPSQTSSKGPKGDS